jgi:Tfp pilus assembly protein PilO
MPKELNIFICCVIIGLLVWFLVLPKYQTLESLQSDVNQKELELSYGEQYSAGLQEISSQLDLYQKGISKIDSALPAESSLPSLFDFLQKSASENGLLLNAINFNFHSETETAFPSETAAKQTSRALSSGIKEIHFSLSVSGSYSAFKNFLYCLEKSARFWEPVSFSFSQKQSKEDSDSNEESSISFNLEIKTHTY